MVERGLLMERLSMSNTTPRDAPDGITDDHAAPVAGWRRHASPLSVVLFGVVVTLGMLGALGHERDWSASGGGASLTVHMPEVIRNGEFFEVRISVEASEPIDELVIGVDDALWEDITINTLLPAATEESSEDGELRFTFAELAPGAAFLFKVDGQVNPDIVGGNEGAIAVYDGDELLVEAHVAMGVLP